MKSRTAHVWHLTLLSVLLPISLASFGITAAFIDYTKNLSFSVKIPGYTWRGMAQYVYISGFYLHANGIMVAAGVLLFLTAIYFLIANTFAMYNTRRVATSIELEMFFLVMWWILALVGSAIFTSNINWQACDANRLCSLAIPTLALNWAMVAIVTLLIGVLFHHGSFGTTINKESAWGESTLSHSTRVAERLNRRSSIETAVEPMSSRSKGHTNDVPV